MSVRFTVTIITIYTISNLPSKKNTAEIDEIESKHTVK